MRLPGVASMSVALVAVSRSLFIRAFSASTVRGCRSRSRNHLQQQFKSTAVGISDAFDGGNILHTETSPRFNSNDGESTVRVTLRIKPDPYTELEKTSHSQHFFFRSTVGDDDAPLTVQYEIENASEASYAKAWEDSTVCWSPVPNDSNSWLRNLNTTYEDGKLIWSHRHNTGGSVYFSYFPPFSYERHLGLIAKCSAAENSSIRSLGQTLDGRELECITIGSGSRTCWIIHRQHPGESMAEFYAEGLLNRLLGLETAGSIDGMTKRALDMYTFHIVPNMCPDGAVRGHLRTNACGSNLNREWAPTEGYKAPTMERSPEVYHVLNAMDKTGVDAFLDVHGDEALPFNFLAGAEGIPKWNSRLKNLQGAFLASYSRANSDMQKDHGYEPEEPGKGRLNTCSNQVANRFDCLGVTLEMPFKDCLTNPDPTRGWSPSRAAMLGSSVLDPLVYIHPYLRHEGEFWNDLPAEDSYIRPTENYQK